MPDREEVKLYFDYKSPFAYLAAQPAFDLPDRYAVEVRWIPFQLLKVYDSTPALVGALYAQRRGRFREYTETVYSRFFQRALEIDLPEAIAGVIAELGMSPEEYRTFLAGEGARAFEAGLAEAEGDHVFGVPLFVLRGEPFWGHDRIPLLEERLREYGLERSA
jgi:2-hydroxychromene-2-carboxylate isomerase